MPVPIWINENPNLSTDRLRYFLFFQAEDGIRDADVTGVQTCALPIYRGHARRRDHGEPDRRHVPGGRAGDGADAARGDAPGRGLPTAAAPGRRPRAGRRPGKAYLLPPGAGWPSDTLTNLPTSGVPPHPAPPPTLY